MSIEYLGREANNKGDNDRAIADYNQVLKLDLNNAHAKKWLEEARKKVR